MKPKGQALRDFPLGPPGGGHHEPMESSLPAAAAAAFLAGPASAETEPPWPAMIWENQQCLGICSGGLGCWNIFG